ncbi:MAG: alpha/beta hydrolase [Candidatus Binatia bacterium]
MEEKFIFFPIAGIERTPRDVGLAYEDIFFTTADGVRLNGWHAPYPGARITLLWFHGNAGNISHRVDGVRLLHDKVKANVFIIDYRGYGRSEGTVSEKGTYEDARAALRYLRSRKDLDAKNIALFGQSLGAAVATELAAGENCLALILEAPFASIRDMARVVFPLLPIGPLLRTRYDVAERIKDVKAPILVLQGERDEVIPVEQGKKVFAAAPPPKEFYAIRGAGHNDTFIVGGNAYFDAVKSFIDRAATGQIQPAVSPK